MSLHRKCCCEHPGPCYVYIQAIPTERGYCYSYISRLYGYPWDPNTWINGGSAGFSGGELCTIRLLMWQYASEQYDAETGTWSCPAIPAMRPESGPVGMPTPPASNFFCRSFTNSVYIDVVQTAVGDYCSGSESHGWIQPETTYAMRCPMVIDGMLNIMCGGDYGSSYSLRVNLDVATGIYWVTYTHWIDGELTPTTVQMPENGIITFTEVVSNSQCTYTTVFTWTISTTEAACAAEPACV